ncbi:hypothetical protein [Candidatus Deferrimicrobium sp.]|uniref:hypothetical protein n=1 Tax=Candidatus Deferrimicrobium sp. TaxID=3060586 RepID=UPI002ED3C703
MRKGFLIVLTVALIAAIALPAMAGTDINGFYRAKGYVSNYKNYTTGNYVNPTPADNSSTNSYVEQRLRVKFSMGEENVKAVAFFEQDMMWGDSSGQSGSRNQGGAIQGDSINLETKNIYLWFKVPNTSVDFTVGLQNVTDPYLGVFFGYADMAGVVATFKVAPLTFRVGGFTPWERDTNQADDTLLFIAEAKIAPVKELNVGLNFYFIRDGADTLGTTVGGGASGELNSSNNLAQQFLGGVQVVPGVTKIYMPGVNLDFDAGVAKISGFAFMQFGDRVYDSGAPKTKFGGYAGDLRVEANAGPAKVFLEGMYTSGDKPGTTDKIEGVVVADDFKVGSSSSYHTSMDMQILTPNVDDLNTARSLMYTPNNNRAAGGYAMNGVRLGATMVAAGASMKLGDKLTGKVGVGYLRANQTAPVALAGTNLNLKKDMGTEVNANVNYNIMRGLDFGLYGAYAWLGDGYKVSGQPTPDNLYDFHARVNYAF